MNMKYGNAVAAFGASLALAGGLTVSTAHLAGASTPAELTAIHTLVDAAVLADAQGNYGLPVTSVDCYGTGPVDPAGITDPGIACDLYGPNGWTAVGSGVIFPTAVAGRLVNVGMVYWPTVDGRIDGRV
jgi:hypothetical protein